MERFINNLLTASIHGSVVILAVILLRLLLRKTPRKYICLLWLLAGIRLLMPIEIRSEFSLQPEFALSFDGFAAMNWAFILPWVWGIVAVCFGLYSLGSYLKLKAQVREAVRIRGGWECDRIETAFILGFIKPRIYIPMGMNREAQHHILEHERTHLDKGDHWIKMIGFLALSLHWFNPLVWIAYMLLCKDIELACDERVVQFMELDERKSYSSALLSCSSKRMHFAASPVAFGEVSVKQRILTILNYKKPSFWISLLGVVSFFFVALCLLTSPAAAVSTEIRSPEQQAQQETILRCREDLESAYLRDEFCYELFSSSARGNVGWVVRMYKQGGNTMWTYTPNYSPDTTDGRLELDGKHYAWQSGKWMETETADTRFDEWLNLCRWDSAAAEYVDEKQYDDSSELVFTFNWTGEDRTIHTATASAYYSAEHELQEMRIQQPDHPTADNVYLMLQPLTIFYEEPKTVTDFFEEAKAAIAEGFVTDDELAEQAEFDAWGILFRVDDDRLSGMGSDVSFAQAEFGLGAVSTTEEYWLEKLVDGRWEKLPTIASPSWTNDNAIGVAKDSATYYYLDWSPYYGELEAGQYRMGKRFRCYDRETNYNKEHTFYSEFPIYQSVDSSSPEAKAAVERCYSKIEELKNRTAVHWRSAMGGDGVEEFWVNGEDFLCIRQYPGPNFPEEEWSDFDKSLFPRVDTMVRYQGVGYASVREDPERLSSPVIGMGLSTLAPNRGGWNWATIAENANMMFFERSNKTITFPEGIGVISDDTICFEENWVNQGIYEYAATLTYRFDSNGDICYLEYKTAFEDGREYISYIEIFDDTAEEIDAEIKPYTENLVIGSFSWQDAKAKYIGADFNIRETGFANNGGVPVTNPVEAARCALKEYPDLGEYLNMDVSRDEGAAIWKVTIRSYIDYQATYGYRDIYLTDDGATQLLVFEGPLSYDEPRR